MFAFVLGVPDAHTMLTFIARSFSFIAMAIVILLWLYMCRAFFLLLNAVHSIKSFFIVIIASFFFCSVFSLLPSLFLSSLLYLIFIRILYNLLRIF